ncbi:hypothetical protein Z517_08597 [Fonsecaea pedrosoi CBS 271.37]|uniref:Uncharacterized protein n=1 Tax=Fonsecaea pedrosoi CBS 271.37 TaxID=1442368 RepID=A0A0D2GDC9_9EURO|nr:uncharacterized protein Z517_08597 [Fonsecaea pedrosoi CBS 271.37]KIW78758.1 hypothetical protein Z517_08597 [Fonsecaea pedrosoi CBS 271.37]
MPSTTASQDPSNPKKGVETPYSTASGGGDATTPTTTAGLITPANIDDTPTRAGDNHSRTSRECHGAIIAWGSTSGKLYLSGGDLNEPNVTASLAALFTGVGKATTTRDGNAGDGNGGGGCGSEERESSADSIGPSASDPVIPLVLPLSLTPSQSTMRRKEALTQPNHTYATEYSVHNTQHSERVS